MAQASHGAGSAAGLGSASVKQDRPRWPFAPSNDQGRESRRDKIAPLCYCRATGSRGPIGEHGRALRSTKSGGKFNYLLFDANTHPHTHTHAHTHTHTHTHTHHTSHITNTPFRVCLPRGGLVLLSSLSLSPAPCSSTSSSRPSSPWALARPRKR